MTFEKTIHLPVGADEADHVEALALATISDQVRASGSCAAAQPVAESASSLERLIAFTGRTVTV